MCVHYFADLLEIWHCLGEQAWKTLRPDHPGENRIAQSVKWLANHCIPQTSAARGLNWGAGVSQPQHYWHLGSKNSLSSGVPCALYNVSSTPGLYPLVPEAPSLQLWQPKLFPDVDKRPLGAEAPGVQNHWPRRGAEDPIFSFCSGTCNGY